MANIAGIVSEYNPFHSGHAYHIAETRSLLGDDCGILCVMSGNFVQRGDFAVMEKHTRAACALRQNGREGADLVIELPTPYALASAQGFARGAVNLLNATGICTHLSFGSEDGWLADMEKIAAALEDNGFEAELKSALATGLPYASARQAAVERITGESADIMTKPNTILGIEYLSALSVLNSPIKPVTIRRLGAKHDVLDSDAEHLSASAIRQAILSGYGIDEKYLPSPSAEIMERERKAGRFPVSADNCRRAVLSILRQYSEKDFASFDGSSEGLQCRIRDAVERETSISAIADAAKTKRYARSRICRTLMRAYLGIPESMAQTPPPYIKVLAFNSKGREMLREMGEKATLPIITKPAHARYLSGFAKELFELECRSTDAYALAYPDEKNCVCGGEWTSGVVMVP